MYIHIVYFCIITEKLREVSNLIYLENNSTMKEFHKENQSWHKYSTQA